VALARARDPEAPARSAQADAAWANYWELRCEAEVLLNRSLPV